ncbi:uncharacterized protein LOC125646668 isoform X2 [Ostrea edulis]|uniref:uncharacterized protein LOC125646668 isoform X2 n=1 Tax=Ostrea edulis TaxID=37623 RepID=UPI0024AF5229|nr:uncharacterized protein LOC125646668 isoform X2 [Ostrea edulis]
MGQAASITAEARPDGISQQGISIIEEEEENDDSLDETQGYGLSNIIQMGQAVSAKTSFDAEARPNPKSQKRISKKIKEEEDKPVVMQQTVQLPEYALSDIIQMGQAVSSKTSFDAEARSNDKSQLKISKKIKEEEDEPVVMQQIVQLPEYALSDMIQQGQAVSSKTSFDAEARSNDKSQLKISTKEKKDDPHQTKQVVELRRQGPSDIIRMGQAVSAKTSFDAEARRNDKSQLRISKKIKEENDEPVVMQQAVQLPEYALSDIIQQGQAVSSKTSFDAEARSSDKSQLKISKTKEKKDDPHQTKQVVELRRQGPSDIIRMGQAVSAKTSFDAEARRNDKSQPRISKTKEKNDYSHQTKQVVEIPKQGPSNTRQMGRAKSAKTAITPEARFNGISQRGISKTKEKSDSPQQTKQVVELPRQGPSNIIRVGRAVSAKTSITAKGRSDGISQREIPQLAHGINANAGVCI